MITNGRPEAIFRSANGPPRTQQVKGRAAFGLDDSVRFDDVLRARDRPRSGELTPTNPAFFED
jgi:hypothetical protein